MVSKGSAQLPALFLSPRDEELNKNMLYPGILTYQPLRAWLTRFMTNWEISTRLMLLDGITAMNYIPQIEGNGCLETLCVSRGGICVLSMIPREALPLAEFNYHLESIRLVKRVLTSRIGVVAVNAVHFVWMDSNLYSNWIESMFGLPDVEYTRTVAWWPSKNVWTPYVKAFDPLELASFLESASKGHLKPLPEPVLSQTITNFSTDDPELYPGDKQCLWMKYGSAPDTFVTDDFNRKLEVQRSTNFWEKEEDDPTAPGVRKTTSRLPRPKSKWGKSYPLTAANFVDNVLDTPSHWLVWFQQQQQPTKDATNAWERAARSLQGKVQFGVVPLRERASEILSSIGVSPEIVPKHKPFIRLFPARTRWGKKKSKTAASKWIRVEFSEDALEEKALSLFTEVKDNMVTMLDQSSGPTSVEAWVADGSPKPRLVLFPSKDLDKVPTLLQAIAIEYGHLIHCGLAKRSDKNLATRMNVTKFPAVRLLSMDKSSGGLGVIPFDSAINFHSIAAFFDKSTRLVPSTSRAAQKDEL
eukprot:CAMPEP_0170190622 /NCGR_PEP_ID=MMETSP0040_2-20121228/49727_1 /TAXON_ID=641309 /ORGANISM="Lotharella oceanica, Strain CCMP622" /LENGTH=527 /DNA_ID=CAMNT_0010438525 /DNA_START=12 /DNA_END=1595 /DNA_ORIENTATION=-